MLIVAVSDALGYELRESTIGGLSDVDPDLVPATVATALADDYRKRLGGTACTVPPDDVVRLAATAADSPLDELPLDVDAWARAAATSS